MLRNCWLMQIHVHVLSIDALLGPYPFQIHVVSMTRQNTCWPFESIWNSWLWICLTLESGLNAWSLTCCNKLLHNSWPSTCNVVPLIVLWLGNQTLSIHPCDVSCLTSPFSTSSDKLLLSQSHSDPLSNVYVIHW